MIETRIAKELGIDLVGEVYHWPMTKKLITAYHLRALDEAQQAARDDPDHDEMPDPGNIDPGEMPDMGQMPSSSGAAKASSSGHDVHPKLRQYDNRVFVQGDETMSDERKQEIIEKSRQKHGEYTTEPRPIEGDPTEIVDTSFDDVADDE